MYGDVNIAVEDGNIGRNNQSGTGIQVKIGISNAVSAAPIQILSSTKTSKIKDILGETPLGDACLTALEWGADTIYAIPIQADTAGSIGTVTHDGEGTGTITVSGSPYNAYHVIITIMETGKCNTGTFRVSIDGGVNYSEEMTIPVNGEYDIPLSGLQIKFSNAENADNYVAGETYSFTTTQPTMNNQSVMTAVESLVSSKIEFEYIHVVGTSSRAMWAALGTMAEEFLTKHKRPLFFVCEAREIQENETIEQYIEAMAEECKGFENRYIQVVCSHSRYRQLDGREQIMNNARIVTGLYSRATESQSIGEVRSFPISEERLLYLMPEGIENYVSDLDGMGYLTVRQYAGKQGYFVTSANMMAPGSDFQYAEDVRVLNRLVRTVRQKALELLQTEIDPENLEASMAAIESELNIPIEEAVEDGIISSGRIEIKKENVNILVEESLDIKITYVQKGHIRNLNLTFAAENPYTGGDE